MDDVFVVAVVASGTAGVVELDFVGHAYKGGAGSKVHRLGGRSIQFGVSGRRVDGGAEAIVLNGNVQRGVSDQMLYRVFGAFARCVEGVNLEQGVECGVCIPADVLRHIHVGGGTQCGGAVVAYCIILCGEVVSRKAHHWLYAKGIHVFVSLSRSTAPVPVAIEDGGHGVALGAGPYLCLHR